MSFALRKPYIPREVVNWKPIVWGGGGLVPHMDIAPDGTKVCATDVGGCYVYNSGTSRWVQMATQRQLKHPRVQGYKMLDGVSDVVIAPSDSNRMYFFLQPTNLDGRLYRSDDKGLTSFPTNYPTYTGVLLNGNDSTYKHIKGKIAVDPQDENIVYASNPGSAAIRSFDGGVTWSATTLPVGTGIGGCCFTFDPTSSVVGGRKQGIYCCVYGDGVYRSTDGGDTWTEISSTIVAPTSSAAIGSDGKFYIGHRISSTEYISRYDGSWTDVPPLSTSNRLIVATHPVTAGRIVARLSLSLNFYHSTDSGANWTTYNAASQTFDWTNTPWEEGGVSAAAPSMGDLLFDPNTDHDLWVSQGQGVLKTTFDGSGAPTWTSQALGIEELIFNDICHVAGADHIAIATWDENCWRRPKSSLDTSPAAKVITSSSILAGWQVSVDPYNTNYVVYHTTSAASCGYSTDGGVTFNAFATTPPSASTVYGIICVSNGVILWVQATTGDNQLYRSTDNGTTWTAISITDIPTTNTGWSTTIQQTQKTIVADLVNSSKFYMSNWGAQGSTTYKKVWRSDDAGLTWTAGTDLTYPSSTLYPRTVRAAPGYENHIWITAGPTSVADVPPTNNGGLPLKRSTDGGDTWTTILTGSDLSVFRHGFGKARVSGGYPTLYLDGWYKQKYGLYRIVDNDPTTITRLETSQGDIYAGGLNSQVYSVEGDKDIYGRCYVGVGGLGGVYCDVL